MANWIQKIFNRPQTQTVKRSVTGFESWAAPINLSGVEVTPEIALSLTSVYACVNVIASAIADMPFIVYKRMPGGGREPDTSHPNYDLLQYCPNPEVSKNAFWTDLIGNAVLYGDGFAEIVRDPFTGDPQALYILDSRLVSIKRTSEGALYYQVTKNAQNPRPETDPRFLPENMLHIRSIGNLGTASYNPILLARELIGAALAAQKTAASVFGQGSIPLGYFTVPGEMDDEGRKTLREYWNRVHQGPYNAGKVAFLEEGAQFNPLKVSLEDLQYNETQRQHDKKIAQLFGVPPHKIGILDEATYSNIEEQERDFYSSTVRRWTERAESEVNRKLFTRQERSTWLAELNMNAIIRGNSQQLTDSLVKVFGIAGATVNNVLQELGRNPIGPDGDKRYILNNFVEFNQAPTVNPSELPSEPEDIDEAPPGATEDDQPVDDQGDEQADEASTEVSDSVRSLVADTLARCVKKEVQALRRAVKRSDFKEFTSTFYQDHHKFLTENLASGFRALSALGKPLDGAAIVAGWVTRSLEEVTQSSDPENVLKGWEATRVSQFMEEI